jgi:predicted ester cyclase
MGIGPTGRAVTFTGIWLARLNDGRLHEQWVSFDALGLLRYAVLRGRSDR